MLKFTSKILIFILTISLFSSCATTSQKLSKADSELYKNTMLKISENNNNKLLDVDLALYSAQPKDLRASLSLYKEMNRINGYHDFDYLKEWALKLLSDPLIEQDPEAMLLSIFAASIAKNELLIPLLEKGLQSVYPQIQLATLHTLAEFCDDEADKLIVMAASSNYLDVCMQALQILCQKQHPKAFEQIESLSNKLPAEFKSFFPPLYASLNSVEGNKALKKFLHHSDEKVRLSAINAAAQYKKEMFLSDLRVLAKQHSILCQEAAAHALGSFQDESNVDVLQDLLNSPSENVILASAVSLYKLGRRDYVQLIEKSALDGNIFAITALKDCQCNINILEELLYCPNDQIRLNAALALIRHKRPLCLSEIKQVLISNNPNYTLVSLSSPGGALNAYKWTTSLSKSDQLFPMLKEQSLHLKKQILSECIELEEETFVQLATQIVESNQKELVSDVIELIGHLKTTNTLDLLKNWQQKMGSPYVRAWSNLALFHFDHQGPWKNNLLSCVKSQKNHNIIQIRPLISWIHKKQDTHFDLSAEETSNLLIQSYFSIAQKQDEDGLLVLLDHLSNFESKNKYALAGILMKASE